MPWRKESIVAFFFPHSEPFALVWVTPRRLQGALSVSPSAHRAGWQEEIHTPLGPLTTHPNRPRSPRMLLSLSLVPAAGEQGGRRTAVSCDRMKDHGFDSCILLGCGISISGERGTHVCVMYTYRPFVASLFVQEWRGVAWSSGSTRPRPLPSSSCRLVGWFGGVPLRFRVQACVEFVFFFFSWFIFFEAVLVAGRRERAHGFGVFRFSNRTV